MNEILVLHQLIMDLHRQEDSLKRKKDYQEALRIYWIRKGVEQSIEAIKQLHDRKVV